MIEYKGFTIEVKKYKKSDIYYAHIRELGIDVDNIPTRNQAITEAKCYIDKWFKENSIDLIKE